MSSSSIEKGLIIYRRSYSDRDSRQKGIKYGLHLSSISYTNFSASEKSYFKRRIRDQGRKKAALTDAHFYFGSNQNRMVQDIQKFSGMRIFKLDFTVGWDFDLYMSEYSLDSQFSADSADELVSEDELDLEIQSGSKRNRKDVKKIFKQAKKVTDLSLTFHKMTQNHEKALHCLPMLAMLEECHLKIKVWGPADLFALRDLLKEAKKRNYWPNIKSMVIRLRHSYNQENCSSRFIRFCQALQEIAEIAQNLPWIKIQLKVKYMWRLDESAILSLQEALEKAQNKLVSLSFATRQGKQLQPLFKAIKEMKNLEKCSIRCNESSDAESVNSLEELTKSLKNIQSLRRLKIQGRHLLNKDQSGEPSTEGFIKDLGDFSQITSLSFHERNQPIDETLWKCFSNSISKLPQLQTLILKTKAHYEDPKGVSPDLNGFLDFFGALKSLQNLRTFTFNMRHPYDAGPRINGSQIFQAACEALQNQKELRNLDFYYPWIPSMNSDLQELTKVLANVQKLEHFTMNFATRDLIEPAESDTFMKFAKTVSCLKAIQSFKIDIEVKEVNDLTYEAVLIPFNHFQARNASLRLHMMTTQKDEEAANKISQLKEIYVWKP